MVIKRSTNINIIKVAEEAKVSKSTVSRVINDSYGVSSKTREKVLQVIEDLKYRPNISARTLRSNSNNILGILIPQQHAKTGVKRFINAQKINGIANQARKMGYDVIVFIEDIEDKERLNTIIKEKGICGVLLLDVVSDMVLESFQRYEIPYVSVNWFSPGQKDQCYVKTDLSSATKMSLELLISRGYNSIGIINWEDYVMKEKVIEYTFERVMKSKGLPYSGCVLNTKFNAPWEQVRSFITEKKREAYISFCYHTSMRILKYCNKERISIPDSLALISYDYIEFYDYLEPSLTGIEQQADLMGAIAVEKLIQLVNGEKNVPSALVKPRLVIRDSC